MTRLLADLDSCAGDSETKYEPAAKAAADDSRNKRRSMGRDMVGFRWMGGSGRHWNLGITIAYRESQFTLRRG